MFTTRRAPARIAATAIALGTALSLTGCFSGGDDPQSDAILDIAWPFVPAADFSPYGDDGYMVQNLGITETLLGIDEDSREVPVLAEKWDVKDERTVVFTLRDGVKFHDGTDMTAESVATSLTEAFAATPRPSGLGEADLTAEATGDLEVTVTSSVDDPLLARRFSDPGTAILSDAAFGGENPDPVGHATGPFTITDTDRSSTLSAEAFADYHGGDVAADGLKVTFTPDPVARVNALRGGQADYIRAVPIAQLGGLEDYDLVEVPLPRSVMLSINADSPVFKDESLRQAAAAAIDPQPIVDSVYEGKVTPAGKTIFNPESSWAEDVDVPEPSAKPADADKIGKAGKISLATWTSRPELPEAASIIADQLRAAGFEVDVVVADYEALEDRLNAGEFDLILGSRNYMLGAADPATYLSSDFECGASMNLSKTCESDIDARIAEIMAMTDQDERLRASAELGARLVADAHVVPIAFENGLIVHDGVEGVIVDPMERHFIGADTAPGK